MFLAALIGLPLGIAAGRWAWSGFAGSIGVVPVVVIPLTTLVVGLLALIVAGIVLTAAPGIVAAHTPTAGALRAE